MKKQTSNSPWENISSLRLFVFTEIGLGFQGRPSEFGLEPSEEKKEKENFKY
jgi:hypothetical protein